MDTPYKYAMFTPPRKLQPRGPLMPLTFTNPPERFSGLRQHIDLAVREQLQRDEAEVRHMLGKWVSELEPTILYMRERLVGLGFKGVPDGVAQPVVIRAWEP